MAEHGSPDFSVTDAQIDAIYNSRKPTLTLNAEPVPATQPVASIILGGQPGAGKTFARDELIRELGPSGAVVIDSDEFRRLHPKIETLKQGNDKDYGTNTQAFAQGIGSRLATDTIAERRNVVYDTSLSHLTGAQAFADRLKTAGYTVEVAALAVNEHVSASSNYRRYDVAKSRFDVNTSLEPARLVPEKFHNDAYKLLPNVVGQLEKLDSVDRIRIYSRDKTIYQNDRVNGEWQKQPNAENAIRAEQSRPLAPTEQTVVRTNYAVVADSAAQRGDTELLKLSTERLHRFEREQLTHAAKRSRDDVASHFGEQQRWARNHITTDAVRKNYVESLLKDSNKALDIADRAQYVREVNALTAATRAPGATITTESRDYLIKHADSSINQQKAPNPSAQLVAQHVATALATIDGPESKPPFENDALNKTYSEAQQRIEESRDAGQEREIER